MNKRNDLNILSQTLKFTRKFFILIAFALLVFSFIKFSPEKNPILGSCFFVFIISGAWLVTFEIDPLNILSIICMQASLFLILLAAGIGLWISLPAPLLLIAFANVLDENNKVTVWKVITVWFWVMVFSAGYHFI